MGMIGNPQTPGVRLKFKTEAPGTIKVILNPKDTLELKKNDALPWSPQSPKIGKLAR